MEKTMEKKNMENHEENHSPYEFTTRVHHHHSPAAAAPDLAQQKQLAKPRGAASHGQLALQQQREVLRGQDVVVHGELLGVQVGGLGGFGWVVLVVSWWLVGG